MSSPALSEAYRRSDGFYRGHEVPSLDCWEVKAVVNREPADPYIPASVSLPTSYYSSSYFRAGEAFPFSFFQAAKNAAPEFSKSPSSREKSDDEESLVQGYIAKFFRKIPRPNNLFTCINEVLEGRESANRCSDMALQQLGTYLDE